MILILLGAPGAGKGTQAKMIAEHYHLNHLSTGDLLRSAVDQGSEVGKLAKSYMDAGRLVPDEIILGVITEYLAAHRNSGVLLDGFPRTLTQAEGLEGLLRGERVRAVSLEVPDEAVMRRLSARWSCRSCGRVYSSLLAPLPAGCECGGELYQRDDDRPETIANRLQAYHSQTEPIMDFYRRAELLHTVDGVGKPEEIFARIRGAIGDTVEERA